MVVFARHALANRRKILTSIGAALAYPFANMARAAVIDSTPGSATRLPGSDRRPYTPPTTLATVADIYRRMTVAIRVNGVGPFGFVVDTGANQSVISKELADRLGLPAGPLAPVNGVAGVQIAPTSHARLEIGRRVLPEQTLSILPKSGIGGDGMLGMDSIGNAALTLDFARQDIKIETGRDNWRDPDAVTLKAARRDGQLTLVDAYLSGVPLIALIDSGADNTIGNMALRAKALTRDRGSAWKLTPIISSTGQQIMAEMADLPDLRVGDLTLSSWPVAFANLHTFEMWNMIEDPAILLGVDILSRFESVCLDFARAEVRFRMAADT
ncbi:MAG: aspartyl protease family protein [Caulobacteraceae bacterium]